MSGKLRVLRVRVTATVLAVVFVVSSYAAHAQVTSTFNADLEGWHVTGDNSAAWEATTGNPNGCLSVNDWATGDWNYAVAPPEFLGDWSSMSALDNLSVDIFHSTSDPDDIMPGYIFRIAGPGGAAYALSGESYYPVRDTWNSYSVSLDENNWTIEEGNWSDIASAVNSLRIWVEFTSGHETVRMDNVNLSSTPSCVFIPCVYDDFNTAGTGDWSFSGTGGASNPESYGNGGGYVKVTDSGGDSTAIAPAKFLGDWSSLDNNGYVTIDLRVISRSGSDLGVAEFIRISGLGGSAYVTLDPSEFPDSSLIWKTFSYPLNSSVWTVDSGSWSGLLANVAECTINVEFYDSTETIGFDNFGRLLNSCPPIDQTVQIHDPGVDNCGWLSMVIISSIALNPRDGNLYGLIRSSEEGLYPVTGPDRGIRMQAYDRPAHLIFEADGDAFISENYSGKINKLQWQGTSSVWIAEFGSSSDDDPYGMAFAPQGFNGPAVSEGDVLVVDHGSNNADGIWSFNPDTSESEQLVVPDPGSVDYFDLAAVPNGTVYVCDGLDDNNLYTLDPNGTLTSFALSIPVGKIYSIVYDSVEECLYIAGADSKAVYRVDPPTGNVTLIADGFVDFHVCLLEIDPVHRRLYVADYGYNRVYELCLDGGANVDISVGLEGVARPDPDGWVVPLSVRFFSPTADVLNDTPLYQCNLATTKSGDYAVCQVDDLAPGTYDITVASEHTLMNVKRNVVISQPGTSVDMGILTEGNADNNDKINMVDFSICASRWLTSEGEPAFDAGADFDRNLTIDLPDLVLLATNWLTSSPIEVP